MELMKMRSALQDLIIRLQDAEKGYIEIKNAVADTVLKKWMQEYADERHKFHRELELCVVNLGGEATVKTSFLGELHRMFIDVKLNHITDDYEAIINEIERGANVLISDYKKVISGFTFPPRIAKILISQKNTVESELKDLVRLREELQAIEA
jgi:uncharacterized protein (TIGR02284 family)